MKFNSTSLTSLARFMGCLNFKYIDQNFPYPFLGESTQSYFRIFTLYQNC